MSARQRARRRVRAVVEQELLGRAATLAGLRETLQAARERLEGLEARWQPLHEGLESTSALVRFTPRTTVARALALHPGVAAVLTEHRLDRCERCPVRHDETLAELGRGHDIPLEQLLSHLDALLTAPAEG